MRPGILLLAGILYIASPAVAQRKLKHMDSDKQEKEDKEASLEKGKWKDKISFGGNLGGTLGSGYSFFMIQPMAFYRFTEKTMAGLGVTYYYWSWKYGNNSVSDNSFGFNFFGRQIIKDPFFVHAEYMPMNFNSFDRTTFERRRIWGHALFLGAGMQQKFSDRGGYYAMFLYDVLWKEERSFYPIPYDIRIGFFF